MPFQEGMSSSQGQSNETLCFSHGEGNSQVPVGSLHMPFNSNTLSWKQSPGDRNFSTDRSLSYIPNQQFSQTEGPSDEKVDAPALPHPGDWDPMYRYVCFELAFSGFLVKINYIFTQKYIWKQKGLAKVQTTCPYQNNTNTREQLQEFTTNACHPKLYL